VAKEFTLIIIKPDGINKSLIGNILTKLSEANFEIIASKMVRVSKELAEEHYKHLKNEPFFKSVIEYMTGEMYPKKKVMALVYQGEKSIAKMREVVGATNPEEADPVSLRGKFGRITSNGVFENVVHASSRIEDSETEIKLWFKPAEIISETYPTRESVSKYTTIEWA